MAKTLEQRTAARQAKGKPSASVSISPVEPDAVVQPQKDNKTFAPASETRCVSPMRDRAARLGAVMRARFDARYHTDATLAATAHRGRELLCPAGQTLDEDDWTRKSDPQYPKRRFIDDPSGDGHTCPGGAQLRPKDRCPGKDPRNPYIRYATPACAACGERAKCTRSETPRQIKRYRQRQAMAEPVFSVLNHRAGLLRVRRRGLSGVRCEFAPHTMAYTLGRAITLGAIAALFPVLRGATSWLSRLLQGYRLACGASAPLAA